MADSTLSPFLDAGTTDRSVVAGEPEDFDFPSAVKGAKIIRLANAFGHMSGWQEIAEPFLESGASKIQILLGQAFYQTEPALILALKALQSSSSAPAIEVKLASAVATFHPKVWIVEHATAPFCIVGSGNLSRGGLLSNVECGLVTSHSRDIDSLVQWFGVQWAAAPPFADTYEKYIQDYLSIKAHRAILNAKIEAATKAQADRESRWRHKHAIGLAAAYWRSDTGRNDVEVREAAIATMRTLLGYPSFEFGAEELQNFLRIGELGRIRLGHEKKMLAQLAKLKAIL